MGKLIVIEHGGWATQRQGPAMQEAMGARMSSAWSLVAGRTTYERFADYWPKQEPNPFTEALNGAQQCVASTTLTEPLPWQNSTLLKRDAADAVAGLKRELDENLAFELADSATTGTGVLIATYPPVVS